LLFYFSRERLVALLRSSTGKGEQMQFSKNLDDVIEAGRHVVDTGFDERAYLVWKKKVHRFLSDFAGPDHAGARKVNNSIETIHMDQE
jgi:hypothetical protein